MKKHSHTILLKKASHHFLGINIRKRLKTICLLVDPLHSVQMVGLMLLTEAPLALLHLAAVVDKQMVKIHHKTSLASLLLLTLTEQPVDGHLEVNN